MVRVKRWNKMKWITVWMACVTMTLSAAVATAEDKPAGPPPAKVVVAPVHERMVAENTLIVGTLCYDKVSTLSSEVSGQVKNVQFREGDRLKKGDILIRLNTDFIDRDIRLAEIRIAQIDVQLEKVEKDLKRYETLFSQEAASEKDYDDLGFTRQDLIRQRDMLRQQLDIERLRKKKSIIRAPFDGMILRKDADVGDWVSPGRSIARIGSLDNVIVKVPIAEELLKYSPKGTEVDVTLHALDRHITGAVSGMVPIADPKTKNIMLKIQMQAIPEALENMSAAVQVPVSFKKQLKLIPRDALVKFQSKDFVYTVKEGKAAIIPIHIVTFAGEYIGVDTPMITDGMMVVVDGNQRLRPDQPATAVPAETSDRS